MVEGAGVGALPGKLAGTGLQGSELRAVELGPHLRQRGDAEGRGCEGVPPLTEERCWPSPRLPLGPLLLGPALGTVPPPDSTTWAAPPGQRERQPEQRPTHDCPPQEPGPRCQRAASHSGRPQGWV